MKAAFTAIAGLQPSSIAVALKTWDKIHGKDCPIGFIHLLATNRVISSGVCSRIEEWIKANLGSQVDMGIIKVGNEPVSVMNAIQSLIASISKQNLKFICYADSGPKYLIAAAVSQLPHDTLRLHSDTEWLHCLGQETNLPSRFLLSDLGLASLLDLYAVEEIDGGGKMNADLAGLDVPPGVRRRCRLQIKQNEEPSVNRSEKRESPCFDFLYEKRGRLYALMTLSCDSAAEKIRTAGLADSYNGLRPLLTVISDNTLVRRRCSMAGITSINPRRPADLKKLHNWLIGKTDKPGHASENALLAPPMQTLDSVRGRGGCGPPLALWMGTDPSATLVSLATHQPDKAYVLFDNETPAIRDRIRSLQIVAGQLPIGELFFIASDRFGRGLRAGLPGDLKSCRINITPGTKSQACALAHFPGADLWSLQTSDNVAIPMLHSGDPIEMQAPDIVTAALASSNSIKHKGKNASGWSEDRIDFYNLLAKFLARQMEESAAQIRWAELESAVCKGGRLQISGNEDNRRAEVALDGERGKERIGGEGGAWFEKLTAAAFVKAGALEVRINMIWGGVEYEGNNQDDAYCEADVIARFGWRFFLVSCKVNKESIAQDARRTEADALRMGRFTVPILARPCFDEKIKKQYAARKTGAVCIDLVELANPDDLCRQLCEAISSRSTFTE